MNNFVKSQTGCDYRELIEGINATPIRLCDQKSVDINEKRYFGIRHDVDDDWPTSQKMAEFEASLGLKTTYYLLDSRRYFDYSPAFLKEVKAINNLGHEIGIHNDALIRWKMAGDKGDIREMLDKPLRYLRSAGIEVVGTAAHGDQICRDMGRKFEGTKESQASISSIFSQGIRIGV